MDWGTILNNLFSILSKLSLEDFMLLGIIILLALDHKYDRNLIIALIVILISGLPKDILSLPTKEPAKLKA